MPKGKPVFHGRQEAVLSSLAELRKRSIENRRKRSQSELLAGIGKICTFAVATYTVGSIVEWASRPNCFGDFYYADRECQGCSYKPACKVEKTRRDM
jgi:hypothetical protein